MAIEKKPKQPLPYTVSKSQLVSLYVAYIPKRTILQLAQEVMTENRKDSIRLSASVKNATCLFHKEFMEIIEILGLPENFCSDEEFNKKQIK